jgi:hypothetical protein
MGSSTLNRGVVDLSMKMGDPTYSSWCVPTQSQEDHHEPRQRLLPESEVPCQRTSQPGQYSYPLAHGHPVPLHSVPQNVRRDDGALVVTRLAHGCPWPTIVMVWMARAMMVRTRLWRAGEVSPHRDLPLIRRLMERVRRGAVHRPLWCCTDGLVA